MNFHASNFIRGDIFVEPRESSARWQFVAICWHVEQTNKIGSEMEKLRSKWKDHTSGNHGWSLKIKCKKSEEVKEEWIKKK